MKRLIGIAAAFCFLVEAQAAFTQTKMHTETKTKQTGPGPNVKVQTETVVGTVKEYEAGKKIKITGPNNKDYSFDLDQNVSMKGTVGVGQRVKVEYTKGNMGNHVSVVSLVKGMKSKKTRKAA